MAGPTHSQWIIIIIIILPYVSFFQSSLRKKKKKQMQETERQICETAMLLLLLSHVSRVRLCATPERAAHQAPVPGILQARMLEWVAIYFFSA